MASWSRDGIAGLQSVVLYSLPELDGAIDTVPLGGLVGDNIFLVSERVTRLSQRIKKWVHLRRSRPQVSSNGSCVLVMLEWHPVTYCFYVLCTHHDVASCQSCHALECEGRIKPGMHSRCTVSQPTIVAAHL